MVRGVLFFAAVISAAVSSAEVHGEGAEGSVMGPVAFLWPEDRPWSAAADNTAPCGSTSGPMNRTEFPLVGGAVALTIADDAYNVAFRIAYGNDPKSQSDFRTFVPSEVKAVEAGHQCYKAPTISNVADGTNATIQLEYWSNDSGRDESFYACADITIVSATAFTDSIPCFNVTATDFEAPASTNAASSAAPPPPAAASTSDDGLTSGQKAGIAVGAIIGASAIIGAAVFFAMRKRSQTSDSEAAPYMTHAKAAHSVESVPTAALVIASGRGAADASLPFEGSVWGWGSMSTALLKITYAYSGYASANDVMNEIRNPVRTLKTATRAALATVCLMYLFVNLAYFSVVDGEDIKNSGELIAGLFFERVFGKNFGRRVLSLAVAISTAGNVMAGLFSQSRINQEVARQGVVPFGKFFASSKPFNAPLAALSVNFVQAFFIIVATPPADVYAFILDVQSYAGQFFAFAVVIGLVLLRSWQPDLTRPYKAHALALVFRVVTCIALLIAPFVRPERGEGDVKFWYGTYALTTVGVLFIAVIYWYSVTIFFPWKGGYELVERSEVLEDGTTVTVLVKESHL
ncbi:hypothetical protein Dda_5671 [Drechslerella dactyloides]|uniref:Copper acquisition factor BIM1-like domain-containing protein n=1 Tax=Drechslerella dactyloides TaxID=74499 RepID=A0AAD6J0R8_DREDA|nr:hypothetical protein Dda_5671 [Drechslerella dactyloides]